MLLTGVDLLFDDPFAFLILLVAVAASLTIAISFHEFSHAFAAYRLGDATAQRLGRLTLNPKAHLDPAGSVLILIAGFGWGKPVPVNPYALRNGRQGMALVSLAGPLSNVILAVLFAMLFRYGVVDAADVSRSALRAFEPVAWVTLVATFSVTLNLILAAFNLLPITPLDGSGILSGVAPRQWLPAIAKVQMVGPIVLIALIASNFVFGFSVLGFIFSPVLRFADFLVGG